MTRGVKGTYYHMPRLRLTGRGEPRDEDGVDWSAVRRELRWIAHFRGCEVCGEWCGDDQLGTCDACREAELLAVEEAYA